MGIHNNKFAEQQQQQPQQRPELPKLITPDDNSESSDNDDSDDDDVTQIEPSLSSKKTVLDSPISIRSMPPSSAMLASKTVVDGNIHSTTTTAAAGLLGVTTNGNTGGSNSGVWGRLGSWFSPASVAAAQAYLLNTNTNAQSGIQKTTVEHKEDDDEEEEDEEEEEEGGFTGLITRRRSDADGWESMDDEEGVVERWKETMEVWTEDEDDEIEKKGKEKEKSGYHHHHHRRSPKARRGEKGGNDGKQGGRSSNTTTTYGHGHNTFPFRYSPKKKRGGRTPLPGILRKMEAEGVSGHAVVETVPAGNGGMITGSPEDDLD